jgi:hypothetical protein
MRHWPTLRAFTVVAALALAAGCASSGPVADEGVAIRDLAQLAGTYGGFTMTERGRDFGTVRIAASGAYEANASATHGGVFAGRITLKDGKATYLARGGQQMFGTGQGRLYLYERGGARVLRWVPDLSGAATETPEIK